MKKILYTVYSFLLLALLPACENQEWEFADFDYTTAYFPFQSPVRTLILDDTYEIDNSNDLQLKFIISAAMGGVYENRETRTLRYEVDETLADGLVSANGDPVMALPQTYYSFSGTADNTFTIPSGALSGGIEVQLSEAFLNDSLAVGMNYVIPLRLVEASTDSILMGKPVTGSPDVRRASDWEVQPKNFTLFGIKYVNKYHGTYLMRGESEVRDAATNDLVEEVSYRQNLVVNDEVVRLGTFYRNSVTYSNEVRLSGGSPGTFKFAINFNDSDNATIAETEGSDFPVTGTATFVAGGDTWGGKDRNAIYLDYTVNDGTYLHHATDTLVFRNKGIVFEEFDILLEN